MFRRALFPIALLLVASLAIQTSGSPTGSSSSAANEQNIEDADYWKGPHYKVYADKDGEALKPAVTLELLEDLARFYKTQSDTDSLRRLHRVQALIDESKHVASSSDSCDLDAILSSEKLIDAHEFRPNILRYLQFYEGQRASKCLFSNKQVELESLNKSMDRLIQSMFIYYSNSSDQQDENRAKQLQKLIDYNSSDAATKCWLNSMMELSELMGHFSEYPTLFAYTSKLRCKTANKCLDFASQPELPSTKEEEYLVASVSCALDSSTSNFEDTINLLDPKTFSETKCHSAEYKAMISELSRKYKNRSYALDYVEDSKRRLEKFCKDKNKSD